MPNKRGYCLAISKIGVKHSALTRAGQAHTCTRSLKLHVRTLVPLFRVHIKVDD